MLGYPHSCHLVTNSPRNACASSKFEHNFTQGQPAKVSKWEMRDISSINELEKKSHLMC